MDVMCPYGGWTTDTVISDGYMFTLHWSVIEDCVILLTAK